MARMVAIEVLQIDYKDVGLKKKIILTYVTETHELYHSNNSFFESD
jgi:hypothetical protein